MEHEFGETKIFKSRLVGTLKMAYNITFSKKKICSKKINITKLDSHSDHQIYKIMSAWGNYILPIFIHVYIIMHGITSPLSDGFL